MFRDKERGAALIEFTLVVPLLLLLIFGLIEFSLMFYDKAVITNASREVARDFAIYRQTPVDKAYLDGVVNQYAQNRLISLNAGTVPALETLPADPTNKTSSDQYVTATVTYTYDWFFLPGFMRGLLPDITLTANTVMRNEGYEP